MPLKPVNARQSHVIGPSTTSTDNKVEDALPTTIVLDASVIFINWSATASVQITLTQKVDLGVSGSNPEDDGFVETQMFQETLAAGAQYIFKPDFKNLVQYSETPSVEHFFDIENLDAAETAYVNRFVVGTTDTTTLSTNLTFVKVS